MQLAEAKSIALWGFGREGKATYKFLKLGNIDAKITIITDEETEGCPDDCDQLTGTNGTDAIASGTFDVVIKSPGISLYRAEINTAKKAGTYFTSATNIWLGKNRSVRTIAVTGTKGKSTTAKLIHHILSQLGINCELAGNVGRPLMEIITPPDVCVIELSSYQIADLEFSPEIAVALNLYPEHIPWHGSVEQYYADKLRIFSIPPSPKAVLNADNIELKKRLGNTSGAVWFNSPLSYFARADGVYKNDNKIISVNNTSLLGAHNMSNIAAAFCAVEIFLGDLATKITELKKAVASFTPLPHRLELLGEKNGVLFVNDSISTTPQSAVAALEAFEQRNKIIILGGQDRGLDYSTLGEYMNTHNVKTALTVPDNGPLIAMQLRLLSPKTNIIECNNLEHAVGVVSEIALGGDVVLLSPAAPSFGHFKDYTDRGDRFTALCGF